MYRVLRRENRCEEALNLPRILSYNMRSIWGKTKHLADDIHERAGEIIFLSEVWEKSQNKKHQYQIEKMFEMENISYISTPRPGIKRGGGAALAICTDRFSVSKLNMNIPKPLEIVWALLKPIVFTGEIRKIILCSFYSPPRSRKNAMLIDHISLTYNSLKIQYPDAFLIFSGDKNSLDERSILALNTNFRQMVQNNTRKDKILTIIISDLHKYYHNPVVIPPVPVDVPGQGVPSDHNGVLALPLTSGSSQRKTVVQKVKVRPMPDTLINKFGSVITTVDWSFLHPSLSATEMVEGYEKHTTMLVDEIFPLKNVSISNWDKPYFTEELQKLRRLRQRVYQKSGRSEKYLKVKLQFEEKLKSEAEKYRQKIIKEVNEGKRCSSYSALRKLDTGHNSRHGDFVLPQHAQLNLSPTQSAEKHADFFFQNITRI